MRKAGLDYHELLKDSFKELKKRKVGNLIIDLRENYGGDNILAVALYSYLTAGSFTAMAPSLTKLSGVLSVSPQSTFPAGNYPFLRTHKVTPLANGYFELRDGIDSKKEYDSNFIYSGPGNKPTNIGKNKFAGKVYCLTSPLSFSAAANFATLLQRDNRATFIGEETGGAKGAYCGGGYYTVTLPHSEIRLQIPFMHRSVSGLNKNEVGRGVIPDYPVKRTIEDVRAGYDRCFEKALELIGG
jgi:C-terminal processing protease CtpA/Prc